MHAAKLLEVAAMLDKLPELIRPDDQFDMNQWYGQSENRDGRAGGCGTAACAAGWASQLLPHLGLKRSGYTVEFRSPATGVTYYEYTALAYCFDIDNADARRLFGYEQPNDPAKLAALLREYVAARTTPTEV